MRAFTAIVAATATLTAAPVQAWWDNGHMLVGEIASQLLTPTNRATIQKVLADWDRSFPNTKTISTAAIWPDLVKCSKNTTSCTTSLLPSFSAMDKWHYMNLPLNANGTQWDQPSQISRCSSNLSGSLWSANLALRQLIHIVADIHQPLHAVAAVSELYPGGDTGGNLYVFKAPCASTNLHALFDAAGGELTTNWALKMDETRPLIQKNATELIKTIPLLQDTADFSSLTSLAYPAFAAAFTSDSYFKKIVFESYQIATSVVYPGFDTTFDANKQVACPSPFYFTQATALSKQRIALAGKRLAMLLTKIAEQFRANGLV